MKNYLLVLIFVFFALFFIGYIDCGIEIIKYGFTNAPLSPIVMVCSLFSAVVCLVGFFIVNALEKDIAEWLEILEKKITDNKHP